MTKLNTMQKGKFHLHAEEALEEITEAMKKNLKEKLRLECTFSTYLERLKQCNIENGKTFGYAGSQAAERFKEEIKLFEWVIDEMGNA